MPSRTFHPQSDIFVDHKRSWTGPRFCGSIDRANLSANFVADGITHPPHRPRNVAMFELSRQRITDSPVRLKKTSKLLLVTHCARDVSRSFNQLGVKSSRSLPQLPQTFEHRCVHQRLCFLADQLVGPDPLLVSNNC